MRGKTSLAIASAFLGALLLSPLQSWSEPKPTAAPTVQHEVNVGQPGQPTPAAKPTGAPGKTGGETSGPPATRRLRRNPFVPPTVAQPESTPSQNVGTRTETSPTPRKPGKPTETPKASPPSPPPFKVAGLFSSGGLPTALLIVKGSEPVDARVGQTVKGYTITSINLTTRQVVVQMKGYAFRLSLPKSHDTPGESSPGTSGGSSNEESSAGGGEKLPPPVAVPKGGR